MTPLPTVHRGDARADLLDTPGRTREWRRGVAGVGAALLVLALAAHLYAMDPRAAAAASLAGYLYWLGVGVGAVLTLGALRLTRAEFRRPLARPAEGVALLVPLALILLPATVVWRWSLPEAVGEHARWPWLLVPHPGLVDACLLAAMTLAVLVPSWRSVRADRAPEGHAPHAPAMRAAAAVQGLVLVPGLAWFALELGMTRARHWESTLYGPSAVATSVLHGAAAVTLLAVAVRRAPNAARWLRLHHLDQLGKLLIGLMLLWFYFQFAEFLTVWYGDVPAEVGVLQARTVALHPAALGFVLLANFVVPMLCLPARRVRRSPRAMALLAVLVLAGGLVEWYLEFLPSAAIPLVPGLGRMLLLPALLTLAVAAAARYVPLLAVWDLEVGIAYRGSRRVGAQVMATYALSEDGLVEDAHVGV